MKVAVVGCTGLVGRMMLQVLEQRRFPIDQLIPVASQRSVGTTITYGGRPHRVVSAEQALALRPDVALFSAGSAVSAQFAPEFTAQGTLVIDNSSCWRMHDAVPLVVPEVNASALQPQHRLIANPNCSTIQLVVAMYPLHCAFGLQRLVVSTYQSVSGTGAKGLAQLASERSGETGPGAYPHPIDQNIIPHIDAFAEDGFTREEHKMMNESRKIMGLPDLRVSATCVRVPVRVGHSLSVQATFESRLDLERVRAVLAQAPGVRVYDDPQKNQYPMPILAEGTDTVYVGRLRCDPGDQHVLNCWIVADNLRKGAATNAVQIAESMLVMNIAAVEK